MDGVVSKYRELMEQEALKQEKTGDPIWDLYIDQWKDRELFCDLHYIIKQASDEYEVVELLTKHFKDKKL
tara:strand:- start:369 stop:578 length:210 start_codon:yes stop_codon:yes gene_type:complete